MTDGPAGRGDQHTPASTDPVPGGGGEWDGRYTAAARVWSGQPNGGLVTEVADLTPGRVLDVGCGEGADAVWLASHGWHVTGLDVSRVALERARQAAVDAGVAVQWVCAELLDAPLPTDGYDLVSVQYPALRRTAGGDAERALLGAVAPGGTLLVVTHADIDVHQARVQGFNPADFIAHDDFTAALDESWQVDLAERRPRQLPGGGGAQHATDLILKAHRLP